MLKSSSAPAASSFEGIDNAISCGVTGWMLTITDEQEGKDVPQVLLWHRVQGTPVRTAQGTRRKDWGKSRGCPCSAITVSVRDILHWHSSFLLPTNQVASPSFPERHLNCHTLLNDILCLKKCLKQVPMLSPNGIFQVQRRRHCIGPFCSHFITWINMELIEGSMRFGPAPIPTKLMPWESVTTFPTRINELEGIAFENWRILRTPSRKDSSFLLDTKYYFMEKDGLSLHKWAKKTTYLCPCSLPLVVYTYKMFTPLAGGIGWVSS